MAAVQDARPTGKLAEDIIPVICPGHDRPVREVHFSDTTEDGTFMVSACLDRKPILRDASSGDWVGTFMGHRGAVWGAKINREATLVATASADFSARLWNAVDGESIQVWDHPHVVKACDFSPDSKLVATGCRDGKLRIFDAVKPASDPKLVVDAGSEIAHVVFNPALPDEILVGTEEGMLCFSATDGAPTRSIDLTAVKGQGRGRTSTSGSEQAAASAPGISVNDMCIGRDRSVPSTGDISAPSPPDGEGAGTWCVTVCHGQRISQFRCSDHALAWSVELPRHPSVDTASVSHDGAYYVASGGEDCLEVGVGRVSDGVVLKYEGGHHGPVRCLRFNPCGRRYTSASEDGTVRIWRYSAEEAEAYAVTEAARLAKEAEKEKAKGGGSS